MSYTNEDIPKPILFSSEDAQGIEGKLDDYFDSISHDDSLETTILAGPQIWAAPDGTTHALLIVKAI